MNDNDIQIIVSLANGTLSGDAERKALERVAADPELARELAAQIAVIEALDDLPSVTLSDTERSTLRTSLVEQLRLQSAPAPEAVVRGPSRWWKPVIGLASVAAIAVAFVAVVPGLLSSSDESAADVALVAEATTTTAAASAGGMADVESAGTAAPETTVSAEDLGVESLALVEIPQDDVLQLLRSADESTAAGEDPQKFSADGAAVLSTIELAVLEDCIDSLAGSLPNAGLTPLAVTTVEGTQVVHLGVGDDGAIERVISIDIETCSVTATSP